MINTALESQQRYAMGNPYPALRGSHLPLPLRSNSRKYTLRFSSRPLAIVQGFTRSGLAATYTRTGHSDDEIGL